MARVFIVYDTKYGNTKLVAERIAEGIREVKEIEVEVSDVNEAGLERVSDADAILIGAPNHMGGPSRTIMKFIDKLSKLELKAKAVAVFDTHMMKDERAVEKMEKRIREKLPALKLLTPGLGMRVNGMEGPVTEGELPRAIDFGKKIAAQFYS